MLKILKIVVITLAVLFVAAQFVRPDFQNPPVVEAERLEASLNVPQEIASILERSCRDCHTNETRYPWYSRITPVSWWLKDHIDHGREELNFSVWGTYSRDRKVRKLDEICEEVKWARMPLPSYLVAHNDARLSDAEAAALCAWTASTASSIP